MNNLLITMSGGTTSVINATLAGIVRQGQLSPLVDKIYAGFPGISGFLEGEVKDLTYMDPASLEALRYTPASGFIGTTRIERLSEESCLRLGEQFERFGVRYFINIGGNGTIKQSRQIGDYGYDVQIASAPKTVDNDLGDDEFRDVHFTPGFPSCANYWRHKARIMDLENLGACSHDRVLIVQTFGRETGFLAGCARLGDPDRRRPLLILLPEDQRPLGEVLREIERLVRVRGRVMIVMSEGYDCGDVGSVHDKSGQIMYGSSRTTAAQNLTTACLEAGIQARCFIPSVDQRSDGIFVTRRDVDLAERLGRYTVAELAAGRDRFLSSISSEMECIAIPYSSITDYSRVMPARWVASGAFDVTDDYVRYADSLSNDPVLDFSLIRTQLVSALPPGPADAAVA